MGHLVSWGKETMDKVLAIEDDPSVQRALRRTFETAGFDITIAPDGSSAMDVFRTTMPRVVILDLRLPGRSGQDICREIKRHAASVPILVLSAASDVVDKVLLLELGADDYVTKPFSPRELLARVRAAIRRLNQSPEKRELYSFDDVEVNFSKMELSKAGKLVPLTPQEFKMLRFFLNNEERVVSRAEFLIAMLLTSAGLTAASLLIVQRSVENQVRRNLQLDLANSVETFRNFQKEREESLARSAELMADLPVLKALMTSRHAPTIQDASQEMFRLSGGDLFALMDQSNQIVGFHTRSPGITREQAQVLRERKTT